MIDANDAITVSSRAPTNGCALRPEPTLPMAESPRIAELQEKFEENPRRYFASLANEHRKAGDLLRAISICRIYLDQQPSHTAGHVVLGQALLQTGKVEEAADSFNTVLSLDPENLIALRGLGDIARTRGDLVEAQTNLRKVITADPRDHDASARLREVDQAVRSASMETVPDWIGEPIRERPAEHAVFDEVLPDSSELSGTTETTAEPIVYFDQSADKNYELATAAPDDSPHQSLELENLPTLESPAVHEDVADDDFVDTLLPSSSGEFRAEPATNEYRSTIAEPVDLEASEETLAVPDLMEDAGIFADESEVQSETISDPESDAESDAESDPESDPASDVQFRTAEYTVSGLDISLPREREASAADVNGNSEAKLAGREDVPLRTGEYSLARDTGEDASSEEPDYAPVEPVGPFITETVAELYVQQGFTGEALLVYRQLARLKPEDERIRERINSLEERLSEEHTTRQAAIDAEIDTVSEISEQSIDESGSDSVEPDWFPEAPPALPIRARQTVREFFAALGQAQPQPQTRRTPQKNVVTSADIRAAAEITAGFGAFGAVRKTPASTPTVLDNPPQSNPQEDIRRFRAWLDGLGDS